MTNVVLDDKTNLDEKYKPTRINDIIGQPHIVATLRNIVDTGRMTHLLLVGPPGIGKTSAAMALAHELYDDMWRVNFRDFNASDDRKIEFVRTRVKQLTDIVPVQARYHIVFLDEADALTDDAQSALRQMIQKNTDTCKIIFACNYPQKIMKPIKDRCEILRFRRPSPEDMIPRLQEICRIESITYDPGVLELVCENAKGSMRKAIRSIDLRRNIDNHVVLELIKADAKRIDVADTGALLQKALDGDVIGYEKQLAKLYYDGGFEPAEILTEMVDEIEKTKLSPRTKQRLILNTGQYDVNIANGGTEMLQLRCYLASLKDIKDMK